MKILGLTLIAVNIAIVMIGLACSAVSALGYAAVQQGPNLLAFANPATPSPPPVAATATPEPTATPHPTVTATEKESEVEYYRGIFDICIHFGRRSDVAPEKVVEACRELVRRAMQQKWFEAPSENWQWPLPQEAAGFDDFNG